MKIWNPNIDRENVWKTEKGEIVLIYFSIFKSHNIERIKSKLKKYGRKTDIQIYRKIYRNSIFRFVSFILKSKFLDKEKTRGKIEAFRFLWYNSQIDPFSWLMYCFHPGVWYVRRRHCFQRDSTRFSLGARLSPVVLLRGHGRRYTRGDNYVIILLNHVTHIEKVEKQRGSFN